MGSVVFLKIGVALITILTYYHAIAKLISERNVLETVQIKHITILQIYIYEVLIMKKSLIALAVAGAVSAPAYAEFGGSINLGYKSTPATDEIVTGGIILNYNGEVQTNGGSTVYSNVSYSHSGNDFQGKNDTIITGAVVGIKGGFGNISLGDGGNGGNYAEFADDNFDSTNGHKESIGYANEFGPVSILITYDPTDVARDIAWGDGEDQNTIEYADTVLTYGAKVDIGPVTLGASNASYGSDLDIMIFGAEAGFGDFGVAAHMASYDNDANKPTNTAIELKWASGDFSAAFASHTLDYDDSTQDDNTRNEINIGYALGGGASINFRHRDDDAGTWEYDRIVLATSF